MADSFEAYERRIAERWLAVKVSEISLGWPDSQTVEVFMDGKHVATMTNAPGYEDGIPVGLFNLMRAAPQLLSACHKSLDYFNETVAGQKYQEATGARCPEVVALCTAINKAEGRTNG